MSLQFKPPSNRNRNLKYIGLGSLVVIGTSYVILNTFPHLKTSIYNYVNGIVDEDEEDDGLVQKDEVKTETTTINDDNNDNEPIELNDSINSLKSSKKLTQSIDQSIVDINEWSNDNLKSWLQDKEINIPTNTNHDNLVSLVKSIQENSNEL
ncbi:hypothetical protein DFJ63DRAFT_336450 [Scheffersomyces coipomensis]|uniref:uncharacterized protein n=1 Tax=Scheffersomyces coipomensis TaxID=1788519 RepID=UPI00315DD1CB